MSGPLPGDLTLRLMCLLEITEADGMFNTQIDAVIGTLRVLLDNAETRDEVLTALGLVTGI